MFSILVGPGAGLRNNELIKVFMKAIGCYSQELATASMEVMDGLSRTSSSTSTTASYPDPDMLKVFLSQGPRLFD